MNPLEEGANALKEGLFGVALAALAILLGNAPLSAAIKVLLVCLIALNLWRVVRLLKFIRRQ